MRTALATAGCSISATGGRNAGKAPTASLARTGRNLKDFYDRFLEEPQLAAWLENATPEGPPTSWSLKMGMGREALRPGALGSRGRRQHGPPD